MNIELKHLVLERPLALLDVESTGVNPVGDRIVEIAVLTLTPGRAAELFQTHVNPGMSIPSSATAIHGLSDADVRNAPPFSAIAHDLVTRLDGCDLAGFGIIGFDLPLLHAEFTRAGVPFCLTGRAVLDALHIYRRYEPRSLSAAVQFYLDREHLGAHSAPTDAQAAINVLDLQIGRYSLPPQPHALHAWLAEVDIGGRFRRTEAGIVFGFGKYTGKLLRDVAIADKSYLEWILTKPFLPDVHALVREALVAANTRR